MIRVYPETHKVNNKTFIHRFASCAQNDFPFDILQIDLQFNHKLIERKTFKCFSTLCEVVFEIVIDVPVRDYTRGTFLKEST